MLGGPNGRSERVRKISPLPGLNPRTIQPVASRCIDWAIPALEGIFKTTNRLSGKAMSLEIRNKELPNTSPDRYRYVTLSGDGLTVLWDSIAVPTEQLLLTWGARTLGGCKIHFLGAQEKPSFHFIVMAYLQFKTNAIFYIRFHAHTSRSIWTPAAVKFRNRC